MASRQGLRLLSKIYQNLPTELLQRAAKQEIALPKAQATPVQSTEKLVTSVNLEARLQHIEVLLEKMLSQKRVRTVERDEDALIVKIIDEPINGVE